MSTSGQTFPIPYSIKEVLEDSFGKKEDYGRINGRGLSYIWEEYSTIFFLYGERTLMNLEDLLA